MHEIRCFNILHVVVSHSIWKLTKDLSLDNLFLELISNEQLSDLIMSKLSITIDLNQNQDI